MAGPRIVVATATDAGQRLDRVLARALPDLSRSRLKALIAQGHVTHGDANGETTIVEPSRTVKPGERFAVDVPEAADARPEAQAIPLDVLYEDDAVIVLDKPAGLVVHPAAGNPDRTLVNALLHHCGDSLSGIGGVRRPGIVHRLDKDTSGVMVAAKTDAAHQALSEQFARHTVDRAYLALARGAPTPPAGRVEGAIGRHPQNRKKMAVVGRGGKPAATGYRTLRRYQGGDGHAIASLIQCRLDTGRTHQVRVHMAHIGHPLVGDPLYGRPMRLAKHVAGEVREALAAFGRQALHARELAFRHPTSGQALQFASQPPHDIQRLIDLLDRRYGGADRP